MTDSHQPDQPAGEETPGQDRAPARIKDQAGERPAQQALPAEAQHTGAEDHQAEDHQAEDHQAEDNQAEDNQAEDNQAEDNQAEDNQAEDNQAGDPRAEDSRTQGTETEDTQAQGAPDAPQKAGKKGLLLGLGVGAVVVVALVLTAFVWPGFLAGPGKPDGKAAEAVAALASKDPGQLEKVSCHGPDGKATTQMPAQALQLIQAAKQTGPPQLLLDTQAVAPVDLTLSAQGQTQNLQADVVLGVTNGEWCMNGISQRQ
ncbi:hypothetical protein [Pseudonocardia acidicola]|uniref:Uncharacterized protein n=1 Tax=Pseudonocardia acidicola TaxID=2724939 RepID=A0ABX1SGW1_9PSEU|nr:hypothetical protein [Pseudonocardia acidicola]NMH99499.1 hypothetical protein [Pseudonocardia acidicola]